MHACERCLTNRHTVQCTSGFEPHLLPLKPDQRQHHRGATKDQFHYIANFLWVNCVILERSCGTWPLDNPPLPVLTLIRRSDDKADCLHPVTAAPNFRCRCNREEIHVMPRVHFSAERVRYNLSSPGAFVGKAPFAFRVLSVPYPAILR